MAILDRVNYPADLKKLSIYELKQLSEEIRDYIKRVVGEGGGHLASNLGVVELTISLLYTLNPPKDKIMFDVGHQCYTFKILTGRKKQFPKIRKSDGISGFIAPDESEYDLFYVGHASNSLSLVLGLAASRDLKGEKYKIVDVIGDGALTGGEAWEALNNLGHLKKDVMIVLNDNEMSIAKNVGAISSYFSKLRAQKPYRNAVKSINEKLSKRGKLGKGVVDFLEKTKLILKQAIIPGMLFEELGILYFGPFDGHNIPLLIEVFSKIKDLDVPRIVHVITKKGKGLHFAEENPEVYHSSPAFLKEIKKKRTFSKVFGEEMVKIGERRKDVVAITAAMELGTGLKDFKERFPERFFDVGIAEQHAVSFASGLSKDGTIPVVAIYSTFLQRALDQIILDVGLQKNKVIFAVDRAGLVPGDGPTHQGIFDLSYFSFFKDFILMSPKDGNELSRMLNFALQTENTCVIRYPKDSADNLPIDTDLTPYRAEVLSEGDDLLIISLGKMSYYVYNILESLHEEGIYPMVLNMRFANPLDIDTVLKYAKKIKKVLIVEDHFQFGGIGTRIKPVLMDITGIKIKHLAVTETYPPVGTREELLKRYKLNEEGIKEECERIVGKKIPT